MMKREQLEYARRRLDAIYSAVKNKMNESDPKVRKLKAERTKMGKEAEKMYADYQELRNKYNDRSREIEAELRELQKPAAGSAEVHYQRVLDELMLGDQEQALRLLQDFEKTYAKR